MGSGGTAVPVGSAALPVLPAPSTPTDSIHCACGFAPALPQGNRTPQGCSSLMAVGMCRCHRPGRGTGEPVTPCAVGFAPWSLPAALGHGHPPPLLLHLWSLHPHPRTCPSPSSSGTTGDPVKELSVLLPHWHTGGRLPPSHGGMRRKALSFPLPPPPPFPLPLPGPAPCG